MIIEASSQDGLTFEKLSKKSPESKSRWNRSAVAVIRAAKPKKYNSFRLISGNYRRKDEPATKLFCA